MNSDKILSEIARLAGEKLDWSGPFRAEMRLVEDLQLDSIRLLTLAMEVEDHFRICLDEDDEEALVTVGDLVTVVGKKLAA